MGTVRTYIGVDLGKKGGLVATQNNRIIKKIVMPLIADEDVDVHTLIEFVESCGDDVHVIFEKFGGFFGYGKRAVVSLARQGGFVESALILKKIAHTRVVPQSWQKIMWEGTKIIKNNDGRKDTKKISLLTVNRLFPGESFLATARSSKPHDGLIDATLLSLYGQRKGL